MTAEEMKMRLKNLAVRVIKLVDYLILLLAEQLAIRLFVREHRLLQIIELHVWVSQIETF